MKKPHHHGDLPRALVQAGLDILAEEGMEGLTLRKCAARAGVSHGAPAHHFDGLDGLKVAIARYGFVLFRETMVAAREAGEQTDIGRLKSIARGYFAFVSANPALFTLMFSIRGEDLTEEGLRESDSPSYAVLREACAPFATAERRGVVLEAQVWSFIHGYCGLSLLRSLPREIQAGAAEGAMEQVLDGLEALVAPLGKRGETP